MDYAWAKNKMKLARAIGVLPLGATEDMVLEKYQSMGGLVEESEISSPAIEAPQEEVVEKPKRKKK